MKSIIFTVFILLGALHAPAALAQQSVSDFLYGFCNTATFSKNDSFATNLYALSYFFTQNSSQFLYSSTSFERGSESDYVYGMYQCRGDISLSDCSSCVTAGLAEISAILAHQSTLCGALSRGSRLRYRGCYLRYENYPFDNSDFAYDYEVSPTCTGSSNESSAIYQRNLDTALQNSATAAPKHALFGYNATSVGSGSNTAFALTQCLGYLNASQCAACLSQVSNYKSACNRSVSGEVYFHVCYYLFNNTSFLFTYGDSRPSPAPFNIASASPDSLRPSQAPFSIDSASPDHRSKNHTPAIVGVAVGASLLVAITAALALCFLKRRERAGNPYKSQDLSLHEDEDLQMNSARRFSLKELQDATGNFHPSNKLGEGGFGPVYQGRLISGIQVAIKMLSAQSHQGKTEFLNEVKLITTVQHRNLIQLLGYCVEGSKPLLIYEYLPKRSLNLHLFDVDSNDALDWHTRFNIIVGIAQGLRYLHNDSPVRIIHRDIKTSNILLDNNLNPKIADFGLAKLFGDDRTHLTTRVIGTLGYLAPEYAISGQLTEKADVYSFGLVALEVVSGRKVMEYRFEADKENLLDWTWKLYANQQQLQIVDKRMQNGDILGTSANMQVNVEQVIRVVHVALLCTQLQPQERPSMSEVHNMIIGQAEILNLPTKRITFGMLTPIENPLHDASFDILSSSTMPLRTSQIPEQSTSSYDVDSISQVEPR